MKSQQGGNSSLLSIHNLRVCYGKICPISNISFDVQKGTTLSIVGPNGAGKSSLLNAISGFIPHSSGKIIYAGMDVSTHRTYQRSRAGLILVPEGRRLFTKLTVEENLKCGHIVRPNKLFHTIRDEIYDLFPRLAERRNQIAGHLSGGEQQMVAIGRAMASCPKLLMLDEPSMGLAPQIVKKVFEAISAISKQGITIILVEQNIGLATRHSLKTIILEGGKIQAQDNSTEILNNPNIRSTYLGVAL
ncbi:ABC transporter ATP-binding protein [Candidatus Ichthyocystis hellenicum]|uniref:ABC transporter ATP-binding protein n=1 Tax=Candidatus Ichthyocystis hellenicum TaxID=1561003 RepID=UPI000A63FDA7|nr:ABC transporter ATP-binding protein [Candidatus Ichthyocystis hellenicum]